MRLRLYKMLSDLCLLISILSITIDMHTRRRGERQKEIYIYRFVHLHRCVNSTNSTLSLGCPGPIIFIWRIINFDVSTLDWFLSNKPYNWKAVAALNYQYAASVVEIQIIPLMLLCLWDSGFNQKDCESTKQSCGTPNFELNIFIAVTTFVIKGVC